MQKCILEKEAHLLHPVRHHSKSLTPPPPTHLTSQLHHFSLPKNPNFKTQTKPLFLTLNEIKEPHQTLFPHIEGDKIPKSQPFAGRNFCPGKMGNLRTAMDATFWDMNISTPQALDGASKAVPGDPIPIEFSSYLSWGTVFLWESFRRFLLRRIPYP
ncbi:hypothetical protein ABFS82_03G009400 [Erythranthe guttata]